MHELPQPRPLTTFARWWAYLMGLVSVHHGFCVGRCFSRASDGAAVAAPVHDPLMGLGPAAGDHSIELGGLICAPSLALLALLVAFPRSLDGAGGLRGQDRSDEPWS